MKKLHLILIVLLVFTSISCDNDKSYHTKVKGKVINFGSKQPIDSVLVVMQDGISSGGGWFDLGGGNTSSDKKSFAYTDSTGYFEIELKGGHCACISFNKVGYTYEYHDEGSVIGFKPYPEGDFENEIFEMEAKAKFSPFLKSKDLSYNNDTVFFEMLSNYLSEYHILKGEKYGITGFYKYFYGKGPFRYGRDDFAFTAIGDTYKPYRITLTRQGVKTVNIDSVYIKAFTTFNDTIFY